MAGMAITPFITVMVPKAISTSRQPIRRSGFFRSSRTNRAISSTSSTAKRYRSRRKGTTRFRCTASRQKLMTTSMAASVQKAAREAFRKKISVRKKNASALTVNTTRKGSMADGGTSAAFLANMNTQGNPQTASMDSTGTRSYFTKWRILFRLPFRSGSSYHRMRTFST